MDLEEFKGLEHNHQMAHNLGLALAIVQAYKVATRYLDLDAMDQVYLGDAVARLDAFEDVRRGYLQEQ